MNAAQKFSQRLAEIGVTPPKDPSVRLELWDCMQKGSWLASKRFDDPAGSMVTLCREDEAWQAIYSRIDQLEGPQVKNE